MVAPQKFLDYVESNKQGFIQRLKDAVAIKRLLSIALPSSSKNLTILCHN